MKQVIINKYYTLCSCNVAITLFFQFLEQEVSVTALDKQCNKDNGLTFQQKVKKNEGCNRFG